MATLNETSTPTRIRTKVAATLGIAAFTGAVFAAAQLLGPSGPGRIDAGHSVIFVDGGSL